MTRTSFQKGYVFARETERGKVHVIRYRVRTADGQRRHRAETVNSPKHKDAERVLPACSKTPGGRSAGAQESLVRPAVPDGNEDQ